MIDVIIYSLVSVIILLLGMLIGLCFGSKEL